MVLIDFYLLMIRRFEINFSYVPEIRQSKRRRLESDDVVEKDLYLLEDTASSPVCISKV